MERQTRNGYGVAALLFLSGCLIFLAGAMGIVKAPERPLHIGTNLWIGYEPFHLARASGLLSDDLTLVEARSSPSLMTALVAGTLDGAALTLDEVLRLEAAGQPMAIVMVLDISNGADAVLARDATTAKAPIKGRRIGVEMDGVGAYMLHRFLTLRGLTRQDVTIVPVPATDHVGAFDRYNLDFLVSYEPLVSRLAGSGAVRVFDSGSMPQEIIDVLAIRRDRIDGHRQALRSLAKVWYQGVDLLRDPNGTALERVAWRQGLPVESVKQVLERLDFPGVARGRAILSGGGTPAVASMASWLRAEGAIREVPTGPVLDPSLLPDG